MTVHVENTMGSTKNTKKYRTSTEFSEVAEYKINIQKPTVFFILAVY